MFSVAERRSRSNHRRHWTSQSGRHLIPESPQISEEEKKVLSLLKSQTETLSANTSKDECIRRDGVIRSYIINHDWYVSAEFHLVRTLVMKPPLKWIPYTETYPFIFDYEWSIEDEFGNLMFGDLIYTDGCNNFLIAEVKSMSPGTGHTKRVKNNEKRKEGREQAITYARLWHKNNPQAKKTIGVFVTDAKNEDGTEWLVEPKECLERLCDASN